MAFRYPYKHNYLSIWDKFDFFGFIIFIICFIQLVCSELDFYLIPINLTIINELSISYIAGWLLYFLTAFLKWRKECHSREIIIKEKLDPLFNKFYHEMSVLTNYEWRPRRKEQLFYTNKNKDNERILNKYIQPYYHSILNLHFNNKEDFSSKMTKIIQSINLINEDLNNIYDLYLPNLDKNSLKIIKLLKEWHFDIEIRHEVIFNEISKKKLASKFIEYKNLIDQLYY